ncbi:ABC transporter permease subunit [Clostridium celatum]|uniref:ABC transporter permease subunit n=1 Tax=Clostridium celatum TaxID=36834 RepID=UPI002911D95F|nr:ABC transporter permease subunit [Clostridium celatum]MDU3721700.1 ABC transporter permease subunit [Clostridium celatum]MDU6296156.1 ABC transporter permease subunit [Clostridium celatum]
MIDILNLTKWEFYKILKNRISLIMLAILTIVMCILTFNEFNDYKRYKNLESTDSSLLNLDTNWQEREELLINSIDDYMNDPYYSDIEKEAIYKRYEIAKYKLETNTQRQLYKNKWYFFSDNTFKWVSMLVVLFVSIIGAFNLSTEYTNKTINPLLLLPYKRYKILIAKYLSTLLYGLISFGLVIILGILSGIIVYGFGASGGVVILYGNSGPYTLPMFTYSMIVVALQLINIVFYTILSFLIAVVLKSVAVATIATVLSLTIISPLNAFCADYYDIFKFLPFVNIDFRKFLEFGSTLPAIEFNFESTVYSGITPTIASLILAAYCLIFIFITYYIFCKKDIK